MRGHLPFFIRPARFDQSAWFVCTRLLTSDLDCSSVFCPLGLLLSVSTVFHPSQLVYVRRYSILQCIWTDRSDLLVLERGLCRHTFRCCYSSMGFMTTLWPSRQLPSCKQLAATPSKHISIYHSRMLQAASCYHFVSISI